MAPRSPVESLEEICRERISRPADELEARITELMAYRRTMMDRKALAGQRYRLLCRDPHRRDTEEFRSIRSEYIDAMTACEGLLDVIKSLQTQARDQRSSAVLRWIREVD